MAGAVPTFVIKGKKRYNILVRQMKYALALVVLLPAFVPADVVVDPRVRTFVNPTRIVDAEKVACPETLLRERFGQVSEGLFSVGSAAVIQPGGRLVLDYGCELHGGLQLGCGRQSGHAARVRVRFGESVAEAIAPLGKKGAMNDLCEALKTTPNDLLLPNAKASDNELDWLIEVLSNASDHVRSSAIDILRSYLRST